MKKNIIKLVLVTLLSIPFANLASDKISNNTNLLLEVLRNTQLLSSKNSTNKEEQESDLDKLKADVNTIKTSFDSDFKAKTDDLYDLVDVDGRHKHRLLIRLIGSGFAKLFLNVNDLNLKKDLQDFLLGRPYLLGSVTLSASTADHKINSNPRLLNSLLQLASLDEPKTLKSLIDKIDKTIEELVKQNQNVNTAYFSEEDNQTKSLLERFAEAKDLDAVGYLLDEKQAILDLNQLTSINQLQTVLNYAAFTGKIDIARRFLDRPEKFNIAEAEKFGKVGSESNYTYSPDNFNQIKDVLRQIAEKQDKI
jgi:hypothetical protein